MRGFWTLILSGVVSAAVGLGIGLTLAWLVWPVANYESDPSALKAEYKEDYLILIGQAFTADWDVERARARLESLGEDDQAVADLAGRYIAEGRDVSGITGLATLAYALGTSTEDMIAYVKRPTFTPTPEPTATSQPTVTESPTPTREPSPTIIPTDTHTPISTDTPSPTPILTDIPLPATETPIPPTITPAQTVITPTPTVPPEFKLAERSPVCDAQPGGFILVYVQEKGGRGLEGIEIAAFWPGGEDRFFTGLKPELDPGYADFEMRQGVRYRVALASVSSEVTAELSTRPPAGACPEGSGPISWRIVFRRGE